MPYRSEAQRRYFNANREELSEQGVDVDEWNAASRGSKLPGCACEVGGRACGDCKKKRTVVLAEKSVKPKRLSGAGAGAMYGGNKMKKDAAVRLGEALLSPENIALLKVAAASAPAHARRLKQVSQSSEFWRAFVDQLGGCKKAAFTLVAGNTPRIVRLRIKLWSH